MADRACAWCGRPLDVDRSPLTRYCNSTCRARASDARKAARQGDALRQPQEPLTGAASGTRRPVRGLLPRHASIGGCVTFLSYRYQTHPRRFTIIAQLQEHSR